MTAIIDPSIWCGDATARLLALPAGCVDMVYVDPPYGQTRAGWDVPLDLDELWDGIEHATHERAAIVVHSQGMFTAEVMTAWRKAWRYNLVWRKRGAVRGFLNANRMPLRAHEDICVFYRKAPTYNPQFTYGHTPLNSRGKRRRTRRTDDVYGKFDNTDVDPATATRRHPTSVIDIAPVKYPVFPVQKPLALADWLIRTYTNPGDIVADPCMGSGTALIAGAREGRLVIGGDNHYSQCQLTRWRLQHELYGDLDETSPAHRTLVETVPA